ncbi:hypothetical protein EIP86_000997 [Pleurotus ostreatoroseus]|nr:hypothetical protein EIP86_000997 [Pleurotus ostreatoroseus]
MASEANRHTPSQPLDIPHSVSGSASTLESLRGLVGSPEQISESFNVSNFPPASATSTALAQSASDNSSPFTTHPAATSTPHRPNISRSITSPEALHPKRRPTSLVNDVTHGLRRLRRGKPEHEWTVFGDLMSNDDQRGLAATSAITDTLRSRDSILGDAFNASFARVQRVSVSPQMPSLDETPQSEVHSPTMEFNQSSQPASDNSLRPQSMTPSPTSARSRSTSSSGSTVRPVSSSTETNKWTFKMPTVPLLYKNIFKCSVAYFIGSLFTFCPYLSGFISDLVGYGAGDGVPSPSGHMVATVAVYFNPAKTFGSMFEADTFCLMGLLFSAFVSLSSMSMYWFLEVKSGWEWLADALAILWIGLGMSTIAWMKMWMAKPTFNTACSMTCIILFIVVVKEGGLETLLQVTFIVIVGSTISNVVCYTLWPQRATRNLQTTMSKTLDSFSTLLTMITETFLLEEPLLLVSQEKLQTATKNHQGSFTALKKSLAEAQSERFIGGPGKVTPSSLLEEPEARNHLGRAYEDAVDSLNRLGQHLNGLRSGISVQYELVKASRGGRLTLRKSASKYPIQQIEEAQNGKVFITPEDGRSEEETALLQAAADAFGEIVDDLGPPLKALSKACTDALKRLRQVFTDIGGKNDKDLEPDEFHELVDALEGALLRFESTSNHAVIRLYRKGTGSVDASISSLADETSVLQGANSESIFLVYL